ncbi:STAS domain-containing protein [Pseudonocardia sp. Cha107L01]|uniref:STAS domain-containing protein n=1 Tax=Pseudonocardia sp. Cha107L01 TaxID=3457576 RepID=UPI00403E9CD0
MAAWPVSETWNAWLRYEDGGADVVVVRVVGGVSDTRADELWSAIESALEHADGRVVVVDLSAVTAFDVETVETLIRIGRAGRRRHADVRVVARPASAIDWYLRTRGMPSLLPMAGSVCAVLAASMLSVPGR